MQLRIAARQPAAVAALRRRLVGERRERQDFGAGAAPAVEHMRIDEAERADRAPARCAARAAAAAASRRCRIDCQRRGARHDGVEIEMALGDCRRAARSATSRSAMLAGLDEAEMPLRQRQRRRRAARRRAPACRAPRWRRRRAARWRSLATRLRITPAMRTAGSCAAKPRTTAAADCACRDTSSTSTTGRPKCAARSAVAPRRPAAPLRAVEQAHDAFDHEDVGAGCGLRGQRVEQRRATSPRNRD